MFSGPRVFAKSNCVGVLGGSIHLIDGRSSRVIENSTGVEGLDAKGASGKQEARVTTRR